MQIKCKLISPTNLMLERPMLSPVEEAEFFVLGVQTYEKQRRAAFREAAMLGFLAGATLVGGLVALAIAVAGR